MEFAFGDQIEFPFVKGESRSVENSLISILGEDYNGSEVILDSFAKADSIINNPKYKKIMCSISAGRDSCVMLDLIYKVDRDKKVEYIWFDTGLEFTCMKEHLVYLENRYGIQIKRFKAIKPIPLTCRTVGQPFISKRVSNEIARLQRYDFDWSDDTYENHLARYPKCTQALKWFHNKWEGGSKSNFNIDRNRFLREFLIANPPWFNISDLCCQYAKKDVAHHAYKQGGYDLSLYGVRKLEAGTRSTAYHNCFTEETSKGAAEYRPLFWYSNEDIAEYEQRYYIKQSALYSEPWSLRRSGCACCPYGRDFEHELSLTERYEPNLFKGVNNIFGDSYKYTRMYRQYYKEQLEKLNGKN